MESGVGSALFMVLDILGRLPGEHTRVYGDDAIFQLVPALAGAGKAKERRKHRHFGSAVFGSNEALAVAFLNGTRRAMAGSTQ